MSSFQQQQSPVFREDNIAGDDRSISPSIAPARSLRSGRSNVVPLNIDELPVGGGAGSSMGGGGGGGGSARVGALSGRRAPPAEALDEPDVDVRPVRLNDKASYQVEEDDYPDNSGQVGGDSFPPGEHPLEGAVANVLELPNPEPWAGKSKSVPFFQFSCPPV